MPNKTIYIKDVDLWEKLGDICTKDGESVSGRIESLIQGYVKNYTKETESKIEQLIEVFVLSGKYTQKQAEKIVRAMF